MLGLKIAAPFNRVFELGTGGFEKFDCLCVGNFFVIAVCKRRKTFKQSLVNKAVEKFKLCRTVFHNVVYNVLYHVPCKRHVVVEIRKSNFGFDHPELSRMARSVGVFGSERRAESVDVAESHGICFALKLT